MDKQRDARKKVPGIRHPLLLSFLAGKLAFKHIYKDDDSLYDAIKSTPVFANILSDLEDDSVFVLYNALKSLEKDLSSGHRLECKMIILRDNRVYLVIF